VSAPLWFAIGAAAGAATLAVVRRFRRTNGPVATPKVAPRLSTGEPRALLGAVADQLAGLTSGIEGNAHLLIEAAVQPQLIPRAAERLYDSVTNLRRLHGMLRAYSAHGSQLADLPPTNLRALLREARDELNRMDLGLRITLQVPDSIAPVLCSRCPTIEVVTYLCLALMRLERGAARLTISAEPQFDQRQPAVAIELHLDWEDEPPATTAPASMATFELEHGAARNLVAAMGGTMQLLHRPGQSARALVRLRCAAATREGHPAPVIAETPAPPPELVGPTPRHAFGGVIVLEEDPGLRRLLAEELRASGRNVVACPDPMAARTLLNATPERFELLILANEGRPAGREVAAEALARYPDLKVCLLGGAGDEEKLPPALAERVHRLQKPFGVPELRATLGRLLVG
jgi:hypothetical protein